MKTKVLLLILLSQLTGCVSIGATDLLLTPVGVVGVHHFGPERAPVPDEAVDRRQAANPDPVQETT